MEHWGKMKTLFKTKISCEFDGRVGKSLPKEKVTSKKCEEPHELHYNDTNGTKVTPILGKQSVKSVTCYCCTFCCHLRPSINSGSFIFLNENKKTYFSAIFIFLLAIGIYGNTLHGDFVHDDVVAIVRNPDVNLAMKVRETSSSGFLPGGSSWWSLMKNDFWGMPMNSPLSHKSYRPITVLTFRLNFLMCGESLCPGVFHGTNMLIHGLVSTLALYLCRGILIMNLKSSILTSALFAVHPIHTEAVAGITGRADALACLMMLISFILYDRSLKEFKSKSCHRRQHTFSFQDLKTDDQAFNVCNHVGKIEDGNHNHRLRSTFHINSNSYSLQEISDVHPSSRESWKQEEKPSCLSIPQSASSSRSPPFIFKAYALVVASGIMGMASMLAKETGITVLGISILYDIYIYLHYEKTEGKRMMHNEEQRRTDSLSTADSIATKDKNWEIMKRLSYTNIRNRVTFILTLIVIGITFRISLMEGSFPRFSRADNPAAYTPSYVTRLLTFAYLPFFNIRLLLYPLTLSYDWQMGSISLVESIWDLRNVSSAAFYLTFSVLIWKATMKFDKRNEATLFVSLLFITLPFLPASNLLFPVGFVVAERVLYATSLGVCILVVVGLQHLANIVRSYEKRDTSHMKWFSQFIQLCLVGCTCLLLTSFGLRTWHRNTVWESRLSLFTSGICDIPQNAKMHYNFANLQKDMGNTVLAIEHYTLAIRLWPEYASAHNNLGTLLMSNPAAAEHQFLRAITVGNQAHGGAYFNLGVLYMNEKKFLKAATHFKKSLIIDPSHQEAFHYYNVCIDIALNYKSHPDDITRDDQRQQKSLTIEESTIQSVLNAEEYAIENKRLTNSIKNMNATEEQELHGASILSTSMIFWDIPQRVPKLYQNYFMLSSSHNYSSSTSNFYASLLAHNWKYFYLMVKP